MEGREGPVTVNADERFDWHGGVHRYPLAGGQAPRGYKGRRRYFRHFPVLQILGPLAAIAVTAAAGALLLSGIGTETPNVGSTVQLPGLVVNGAGAPAPTPVRSFSVGAGGAGGSAGAARSMPPSAATQPLSRGRSPSPAAFPSPSSSTAPIPLDSLIPALQSPDPCPMPTKHGKGRPSHPPDIMGPGE